MKFVIQTVLIGALCYVAGLFLPFWSLAIVAFLVSAFLKGKPMPSFLSGFIAVFVLWALLAYNIDQETSSILTNRVAQVFMGISNMALIAVTGIIGGLVGGFGAASGALFVGLTRKKKVQKYYS